MVVGNFSGRDVKFFPAGQVDFDTPLCELNFSKSYQPMMEEEESLLLKYFSQQIANILGY